MGSRLKITVVQPGKAIFGKDKIQTFDQPAHESRDEFRGRVLCLAEIPDGAEFYLFELEGEPYRGPVHEHCLGTKRVRRYGREDERLPSLFVLRDRKVYDYREAPPSR